MGRSLLWRESRLVSPQPASFPPDISVQGRSPILCLAARQPGARPPSLLLMEGVVHTLMSMLQFAVFADDPAHADGGPDVTDCLRWLLVVLGSVALVPLFRSMRRFWAFVPGFVATGSWQGCDVEEFARGDVALLHRLAVRRRTDALRACLAAATCVRSVRLHLSKLPDSFVEQALNSHGDHIPPRVRDGATVMFWLPEVLQWSTRNDMTTTG